MTDPRWKELVADAIGRFTTDEVTSEHLKQRLRDSGDWEVALAQFRGGSSDKVVRWLLEKPLLEMER